MYSAHSIDGETLKGLIRRRPVYVDILQRKFGYSFWNQLDAIVSEFCLSNQVNEEELHQAFLAIEEAGISEDWVSKPLFYLIDHLTLDHEKFRTYELPLVQTRLEACRSIRGIDIGYLEALIQAFQNFHNEIIVHMAEEEDFLFFKILRTEASHHYPQLYPEVFKGSVAMYPASLLHSSEAEIGEMVAGVVSKVSGFPPDIEATPELKNLVSVLKGLESKVGNHTYLESVILFPRAKKMEEELRKRANSV